MREIYFDNAATTKPLQVLLEKLAQYFDEFYANPASMHELGFITELEIKKVSKALANIINCDYDELIYTSGGTESNNLAIFGASSLFHHKNIITTQTEHPSVLECFKRLEESGFNVIYLPVCENGLIDINYLKNAMTPQTSLVSIIHTNNETGVIQDIEVIGKMIKQINNKVLFHVDAVQSFCKQRIDVRKSNIDLLSISAHKIHGLKGCGALYIKKGVRISPILLGGGQQRNIRSGTENSFGIMTFAHAAQVVSGKMNETFEKVSRIRDYIIKDLDGAIINSAPDSSPFILNISFPGIKSEVLLHAFAEHGIYVSAGSACSSKTKKHYVLKAYGKSDEISDSSIRLSFSLFNKIEEAEYFVKISREIIPKLSKIFNTTETR